MTDDPEADARLWLSVSNPGMDLQAVLDQLSESELKVWVEVASKMDIPKERKQTVAKEHNRR